MRVSYVASKIFAFLALLIVLFGFTIPSVGFHGTLERIKDNKIEDIPSFAYYIWDFYEKDRYASVNTPQNARGNLKKMIEISEEIGVPSLPIWNFSLEAPNYPKEAFPYGLPVFIHFDGLSGEVHEMNTINHYVGMAHMERGGIYERALAPYALIILSMLLALFIIYNNKWIDRFMIIPVVLPLIFIGIYWYWLYWFGHNLYGGAITIKPFMPVILGDGKVAQFTTHAYPVIGFWALVAIGVLSLMALCLKRYSIKDGYGTPSSLQHLFMFLVLALGFGSVAYVLKTDIKVDTLTKIASFIDASTPKTEAIVPKEQPLEVQKESAHKQLQDEAKEQESKIKSLELRAGSAGKFKVSPLYKSNCAPCHGVNGEGSVGSALVGIKKEDLLKKLQEYKATKDEMHSTTLEHLLDKELDQIVDEIVGFENK